MNNKVNTSAVEAIARLERLLQKHVDRAERAEARVKVLEDALRERIAGDAKAAKLLCDIADFIKERRDLENVL